MDSSPAREKDREKISASSPKSPKQKRSGARESTANPPPPLDWPEIDWPEIFWLGKEAQSKSATERAHIARQFHSEPIHWTFNLDKPQQEHSQDAQTTDPSPSDKNDKEKNSLYLAKTPKRKRSGARESTADLNPPILWKSYEQMLEEGQNHDAQLHTHDAQANTRDAQPDTDDLSLSSGEDLDKVDIFVTQYPPVLPIAGAPVSTTRLDVDTYLLILLVTTHEYLQNGPPFPPDPDPAEPDLPQTPLPQSAISQGRTTPSTTPQRSPTRSLTMNLRPRSSSPAPTNARTRSMRLPDSWAEASDEDRLLFNLRDSGMTFSQLAPIWRAHTGLRHSDGSIATRHYKIQRKLGDPPKQN